MQVLAILLSLLSPLIFLGGIVAVIVFVARRRGSAAAPPPGLGSVRRTFLYGVAFASLAFAASGATQLVSQLLGSLAGGPVLRDESFRVAFGLAAVVVGTPIWLLLWRAAGRSLVEFPAETGTLGRKAYVYLVLAVSAIVSGGYWIRFIQGVLSPGRFDLEQLAPAVVWGLVWWLHWGWEDAEGQPSEVARSTRRFYAYLLSTVSLVLLAVGVGFALRNLLGAAYDQIFGGPLLLAEGSGAWTARLRDSLALATVGAVGWGFHWHRVSVGDTESILRQTAAFLVGVFGGLASAVSGGAAILFAGLAWLFDRAGSSPAIAHFDGVPGALAAVGVGLAVWSFHSRAILEEATAAGDRVVGARRAYRYLMAAVGLGTLAAGLTTLVGLFIGLVIPGARGDLTGGRWWAYPFATALTLTAVGAPLWSRSWFAQQRAALSGLSGERDALSRRVFIFAVFGVALLATLGGLSASLVLVLQPLFEGDFTMASLDGAKWTLGTVLTAGAVSLYYWEVLKEDRAATRESAGSPAPAALSFPAGIEVTALFPEGNAPTLRRLEARLGVPVRHWVWADGEEGFDLSDAQLEMVIAQMRARYVGGASKFFLYLEAETVKIVRFMEV